MKNLYLKGKGKIHPSPASSPSVGGGGGGGQADVLAVLRMLPAAILALTAALRAEDKEVLGYLILRSISGGEAAEADAPCEERRRGRRPLGGGGGAYRAAFDCDCFDCYTSFWSRWDCSPNRELIHQAIEAFEEHLASRERGGGRGRRRERNRADRAKKKPDGAAEEGTGVSQIVATEAGGESGSGDNGVVEKAEVGFRDEQGVGCAEAAAEETEQQAAVESGERRRGWADVMVLMNSGFWSLWSPRG